MSATRASRERVSTLNRVDLPTLGRPTRATTGSIAGAPSQLQRHPDSVGNRQNAVSGIAQPGVVANPECSQSLRAIGGDVAVDRLDVDDIAIDHWSTLDGLLAEALARGKRAIGQAHPVDI